MSHLVESNQDFFHQSQSFLARFPDSVLLPALAISLQTERNSAVLNLAGQRYELDESFVEPERQAGSVGFFVFGLGTGQLLRELIRLKAPDVPVVVLDSRPDLAQFCLENFDFQAVIKDRSVTCLIDWPEPLAAKLHAYLTRRKDLQQLQWLSIPWRAEVARKSGDLFYLNAFEAYREYVAQAPTDSSERLQALYAAQGQATAAVYAQHPLSCSSGCAGCCKQGNGFDLLVRPVEWQLQYSGLLALPALQQAQLLRQVVRYLAQHAATLQTALRFFDKHLDQMKQEAVNREYFRLTQVVRQDPCPFLSEDETCGVYDSRPLTCRIYGNSYYQPNRVYTCDMDKPQMEKILLNERHTHQLLQAEGPMAELQALHSHYPYGQVMYVWLFTHLDLDQGCFIPQAQLDFQQFQRFVEFPDLLDTRLQALQSLAQRLGV